MKTHAADFIAAYKGAPHMPVMLREVLQTLQPRDGGIYVDGTFGAGGYTRAILQAANCTVYAIDRDPDAMTRAQKMAAEFDGRLVPLQGCFGDVAALLAGVGVAKIDGFVLDLGVSSPQLDEARRGFSFRSEGPLDMRMSQSGQSAADVVNGASEKDLADIIYNYGDEKASRRIARAIVAARTAAPITTTKELTDIVHGVLPMHGGIKTDTATKTFQALRIFVNDELGELDRALEAALDILDVDGRLVVVSFHSLEDGRVKRFFRDMSGKTQGVSRHMPMMHTASAPAYFTLEDKNGLAPQDDEVEANPRARSARLRWGVRSAEVYAHA